MFIFIKNLATLPSRFRLFSYKNLTHCGGFYTGPHFLQQYQTHNIEKHINKYVNFQNYLIIPQKFNICLIHKSLRLFCQFDQPTRHHQQMRVKDLYQNLFSWYIQQMLRLKFLRVGWDFISILAFSYFRLSVKQVRLTI